MIRNATYTESVDVWGLGLVAFTMTHEGKLPWSRSTSATSGTFWEAAREKPKTSRIELEATSIERLGNCRCDWREERCRKERRCQWLAHEADYTDQDFGLSEDPLLRHQKQTPGCAPKQPALPAMMTPFSPCSRMKWTAPATTLLGQKNSADTPSRSTATQLQSQSQPTCTGSCLSCLAFSPTKRATSLLC